MGAERHDDSAAAGWLAPYYSLSSRAWIPCVVSWCPETGEFVHVEGPEGFEEYDQALQAAHFLIGAAAGRVLTRSVQ